MRNNREWLRIVENQKFEIVEMCSAVYSKAFRNKEQQFTVKLKLDGTLSWERNSLCDTERPTGLVCTDSSLTVVQYCVPGDILTPILDLYCDELLKLGLISKAVENRLLQLSSDLAYKYIYHKFPVVAYTVDQNYTEEYLNEMSWFIAYADINNLISKIKKSITEE